jgi:translation elongation factor EF-G
VPPSLITLLQKNAYYRAVGQGNQQGRVPVASAASLRMQLLFAANGRQLLSLRAENTASGQDTFIEASQLKRQYGQQVTPQQLPDVLRKQLLQQGFRQRVQNMIMLHAPQPKAATPKVLFEAVHAPQHARVLTGWLQ